MRIPFLWSCALVLAAVGGNVRAAAAADFQPAVVYDMGGKFDRSFNQSAYDGAERFKKEIGRAHV